jgi:hypothetical protein
LVAIAATRAMRRKTRIIPQPSILAENIVVFPALFRGIAQSAGLRPI